jgi:hypothetical protein
MINLAMDNCLEQLLTNIALVLGFHVNQPEAGREKAKAEWMKKEKSHFLLSISSLHFGLETSVLINTSVFK